MILEKVDLKMELKEVKLGSEVMAKKFYYIVNTPYGLVEVESWKCLSLDEIKEKLLCMKATREENQN